MLLAAGLVFGGALFSQAQKDDGEPKMVDISAESLFYDKDLNHSLGIDENARIMVGDVVFHHNGTVIACDSAVQYANNRIECFKNVIINKDSTFVYGDRAEYDGDKDLARVFSPVIKVVDGDAILYTYNFVFNTATNVGKWSGGGVMYQKDNVMESEVGYMYSDDDELVAVHGVEMRNDSHRLISDSVRYNSRTEVASFYTRTYIWTNKNEIITADNGRYNSRDSTYFFWGDAYIMDKFRETWADTIDYAARQEDAVMYGNIQIDDDEHESSAFGDYGQYWGERGETMLTRMPSLLNYDEEQTGGDTMYMRADTVFMFVRYPSDGPRRDSVAGGAGGIAPDPHMHLRWVDSLSDSIRFAMADSLVPVIAALRNETGELRGKADSIMYVLYPTQEMAEPATGSAESRADIPGGDVFEDDEPIEGNEAIEATDVVEHIESGEPEKPEPVEVVELRARATELSERMDSLIVAERYIRPAHSATPEVDSLAQLRLDSLERADSIALADSIAYRLDSLKTADPKTYKKEIGEIRKAEKARLKVERTRLKYERQDAKYAAKEARRAEKQRLRAEKRAAKKAAKAEKQAERRRRKGWITETIQADSIARANSPAALDSLLAPAVDSLERVDSLAPAPEEPAADTTMRIFRGWFDVKVWSSDMQAVADSMVGYSRDSTLHLYVNPILWNGDSQITADSITLFTAKEMIERAEFFGDPIMGSQFGDFAAKQYNQVKGATMTSWFSDGVLYRHDAIDDAQALYYMQEDNRPDPIALLVMSSDNISFLFADDSLRYINSRKTPDIMVYPMDQIPPSQATRLQGFSWQPERQPTLRDVFNRTVRPSEREFHQTLPQPEFPIAARVDRRREYLIQNRMWADRTDPLPAYAEEFRQEMLRKQR